MQIGRSGPALTFGSGFTFTITKSIPAQSTASATVNVYVVVNVGFAIGFAIFVALKPTEGDQEYVTPPVAVI